MALSDVGVIFVSKGFADFMSNMSKASQSIANFGIMTQNRLKAVQSYNDAMVKTARYAKDIAVSNDRLVISQQKTAQANLRLKTSQTQVAISANQAKIAQANFSKSFNDVAISANKTAVALKRLEVIDKLNDAMIAGTISSEDYAAGLDGINYSASRMSSSLNKSMDSLSILQDIGGMLGGSISSLGNMGATIGGILGTIFPGIGNAVGAIGGYILGAIAGLGVGIVKSIFAIATNIGKAIINVGKKIFDTVVNVFKSIINGVKSFLGEIFNLLTGGIFKGGWNNLGNTIVSSMFKFEILKQVIRKVVTEIRSLADAAAQGAIQFQKLDARLRFLIRMQIKSTDTTMSLAKATELAGEQARQLEFWIAKTALQSPVSVDEVSETVSLAIAMGWAVEGAKELTSAIVDYTSATGLGKDIAERIIYNFAQMKQQGKVTGTELRDLGRGAFMPINTILEIMYEDLKKTNDEMGATTMSFAQFREEAAAGKIDVEGFFKAFEEFVDLNMAGAAYEMNYTFAAVADNLRDLFKIFLGWNVLGPLIQSVTKPFQDFIEMLSTDEALLAANRIGKALAFSIEYVKKGIGELFRVFGLFFKRIGFVPPSIEDIVKTIVKLGRAFYFVTNLIATFIKNALNPLAASIHKKIGEPLDNMKKNFFEWGANLVVSFAKGMIQAAARVLTSVMRYIASILTGWLEVHSPPKILPDIDQWGMDTINEWLHGFTEGDFSILEDLQGSIKDALGALVNFGLMTEQESNQEYLHLTTELIRAMDELNRTGTISAGIFDELRSIGGVYGEELAELLELQIQYAEQLEIQEQLQEAVKQATEVAKQAQIAYDNAVKNTEKSFNKVRGAIKDYNKLLRSGGNKKQLMAQLKIVNASEEELAVNRRTEIIKKSELETAEEQLKLAEEALEAFNETLDALKNQIDLQKDLIKQLTDLAQAQKDTEDSSRGTADALEDIAETLGEIGSGFTWEDPWKDTDLEGWIAEANEAFDKWVSEELPRIWGDAWNVNFGPDSDFQDALSSLWDVLPPAFQKVTGILEKAWDDFADYVKLPSWDDISSAWTGAIPEGMTEEQWNLLPENVRNAMAPSLLDKFRSVLQAFSDAIPEDKTIGDILASVGSYILEKIGLLIQGFADDPTKMQGISTAVNDVVEWMRKVFMGEEGTGTPPIETLSAAISSLIANSAQKLASELRPGNPTYDAIVTVGSAIADGLWTGIKSNLPWPFNGENLLEGSYLTAPNPYEAWLVQMGITTSTPVTPPSTSIFSQTLTPPAGTPSILWTPTFDPLPETVGNDAITGLFNGANKKTDETLWDTIWTKIVDSLKEFYKAESPSKLFAGIGVDVIDGLAQGFTDQIAAIDWNTIWQTIIDKVLSLFGIATPGTESTVFNGFGVDTINGLKTGFTTTVDAIIGEGGAIPTAINNIIDTVKNVFGLGENPETETSTGKLWEIGKGILQDFINGLTDMKNTVWNKVREIFQPVIDLVNLIFGNQSPSAVFYDIAVNVAQGFIDGLSAMENKIIKKTDDVFKGVPETVVTNYDVESPSGLFRKIGQGSEVNARYIDDLDSRLRAMTKEEYEKFVMFWSDNTWMSEAPSISDYAWEIIRGLGGALYPNVEIPGSDIRDRLYRQIQGPGGTSRPFEIIHQGRMNASPVYASRTVNFGDVHITNGMDWEVFKANVHKAILD